MIGLLLIALVTTGLMWPAMRGPLAFDDIFSVHQVKGFGSWTDAFAKDPFHFFRPVKNLFFFLMAQTSGDAILFHLVNLGAYLLAGFGVYVLARRLGSPTAWALAATAIWTLSAANVTVAAWSSCFNISIAAAGICFALVFWDRWRESPSRRGDAVGFFLCLTVALLSYETAIAIAPLAVLVDLFRGRRLFNGSSWLRYGGMALVLVAWIGLRHQMGAKSGMLSPSFPTDIERWQIAVSSPYFLWTHFSMWAAPWDRLECLGSYIWNQSIPTAILPFCWFLLIGAGILAARFWKPGNFFLLGLGWFFLASFPSGNFLPLGNTPYADYYTTIPAIGLAISLAAMLRGLAGIARTKAGVPGRVAWAALAILVAWRGANLVEFRNWASAWSNPVEVMARTAMVRPHQYLAKATVASVMLAENELDLAREYATASIEDNTDLAVAHVTLGQVELRSGNWNEALGLFRQSLQKRHLSEESILDTHLGIGQIVGRDPARFDEAFQQHLLPVLKRRDYIRHPEAVIVTAELFRNSDKPEEEIRTLEKGLAYHPGNQSIIAALEAANRRGSAGDGES